MLKITWLAITQDNSQNFSKQKNVLEKYSTHLCQFMVQNSKYKWPYIEDE